MIKNLFSVNLLIFLFCLALTAQTAAVSEKTPLPDAQEIRRQRLYYEDYREIDGIKIPYKLRVVLPQYEIITEIKHGITAEDGKFTKPKT